MTLYICILTHVFHTSEDIHAYMLPHILSKPCAWHRPNHIVYVYYLILPHLAHYTYKTHYPYTSIFPTLVYYPYSDISLHIDILSYTKHIVSSLRSRHRANVVPAHCLFVRAFRHVCTNVHRYVYRCRVNALI